MLRTVPLLLLSSFAHAVAPAPTIEIAPGILLPMVILGTGSGQKGNVSDATALWLGSTSGVGVDTAWKYGDEGEVAAGIAAAKKSRDSVFLETKIPCSTYKEAVANIATNLELLQMSQVDLLIMHFPSPCGLGNVADTWRAIEESFEAGGTKSIGVSNFAIADLEALKATAVHLPILNQCEMSVSFHDDATIAYCKSQNITYQAYSPLCGGFNGSSCTARGGKNVLTVPEVIAIAAVHNVSAAQVGLKFIVQQGHPLVTAVWNLDYMEEDLDLWSWGDLTAAEMTTLANVAPSIVEHIHV